uniref:Ig-like domain-containing protein n=1 Tax=Tetraodon nigroviridis TaxID=99883 RepID=H3CEG5_TETNG
MSLYHCGGRLVEEPNSSFTPAPRPDPQSLCSLPPLSSSTGGSAKLACLLTKYSPQGAEVSWEVDGTEVTEGVLTSSEEEKGGSYSSFSTLTLSRERWMSGEVYSCKVKHYDDVRSQTITRSQCKG